MGFCFWYHVFFILKNLNGAAKRNEFWVPESSCYGFVVFVYCSFGKRVFCIWQSNVLAILAILFSEISILYTVPFWAVVALVLKPVSLSLRVSHSLLQSSALSTNLLDYSITQVLLRYYILACLLVNQQETERKRKKKREERKQQWR